jgi:hypothetical protein
MGAIALPHAKALEALPPEARDQRIVALCDSAIDGLNEARDLEEVIGIKNAADAFAVYTRKMKAAVEAQNHCQLVVLLAEARIGAELKAAQERGEIERRGGDRKTNVRTSDNDPATLSDIGIPRQRAAEMKKLAEAGEDAIREEVKRANDEGRRPSREKIIFGTPAYLQQPAEMVQFALWLRTGAGLVARLGAPEDFAAAMHSVGMTIPAVQVEAVVDFLSNIEGDN